MEDDNRQPPAHSKPADEYSELYGDDYESYDEYDTYPAEQQVYEQEGKRPLKYQSQNYKLESSKKGAPFYCCCCFSCKKH